MTPKTPEELVDELTLAEQVALLSGRDFWSLNGVERLGIPPVHVTDGPNGARGGGGLLGGITAATYPAGIALGASWDPDLVEDINADLALEVLSKGANVSLAPTCNIHRSVTNGRNFECYSEDPELSAALVVGSIRGLQGRGIAATVKHFVGNESEIQRTTMSSEIDERTLREVYLRPFEDAVRKAGTWGVMSSYNRLGGTYASEHPWLLSRVLRDEWGFDGIVMSDWFGSHSTAASVAAGLDLEMPGPTRDRGDKLIAAVEAGEVPHETIRARALDVLRLVDRVGALHGLPPFKERAEDRPETRRLIRRACAAGMVLLKNDGLLPLGSPRRVAVIGPNARTARIMGGGSAQLNPHYSVSPWQGLADRLGADALRHAEGCTNHRFEPAWQGPLDIAFFANRDFEGPPVHRDTLDAAEVFWVPPFAVGKIENGAFSARVTGPYTATVSGPHRFGVAAAGLARLYVDGTLVADAHTGWTPGRTYFEQGCDEVIGEMELEAGRSYDIRLDFVSRPDAELRISAFHAGIGVPTGDAEIAEAARLAAGADVALVFVGRTGEWDTEGSDLEDITLPGRQDELVAAVAAANPRTAVVLQTGGPVEMPWIDDVPAVLQAWYPGQEAGNAIADVLFGDAEPGGRLPQTFPRRWQDNPTWSQDPGIYPGHDGKVHYAEGLLVGYRHYEKAGIDPLFAFGHGLSYTRFALGPLSVTPRDAGGAEAHVTVTNTGERAGTTVVQLYAGHPGSAVPRPDSTLVAFRKIALAPGESRALILPVAPRALAWFDTGTQAWQVEAGTVTLRAAFSATDPGTGASFTHPAMTLPV